MKIEFTEGEIERYLQEEKEKKNYSLYLSKEDVEYLRKKLKVPLSFVANELIQELSKTIKEKSK